MRFINGDPYKFNPTNNGFIFVGQDEEGNYWASDSTYTKFVQIEFQPFTLDEINARFEKFQQSGEVVTANDIKVLNSSTVIVYPKKEIKPEVPVDVLPAEELIP